MLIIENSPCTEHQVGEWVHHRCQSVDVLLHVEEVARAYSTRLMLVPFIGAKHLNGGVCVRVWGWGGGGIRNACLVRNENIRIIDTTPVNGVIW